MILHVVNLDTLGGVEELFTHFLMHAQGEHAVFVSWSGIHSYFNSRILEKARTIVYGKSIFSIPLPKCLRPFFIKYQLKRIACETVVLWNRIEDISTIDYLFPGKNIIYYEHGASWIQHAQKEQKISSFFQRMNKIIVNSHAAKNVLQLKWRVSQNIDVVETPLRPDIAITTPRSFIHNPLRLGFIGRLTPLKGASLVIDTLHILRQRNIKATLTIAGIGEEEEHIKQKIQQLNLQPFCSFLGSVRNVPSFYDAIDILIIPSIREPLGLVALEAQARGVPVIASCVDGLYEVVNHGKTGFLITPNIPLSKKQEYVSKKQKLPDYVFNPISGKLEAPHLLDPILIADAVSSLQDTSLYTTYSQQAINLVTSRIAFSQFVSCLSSVFEEKIQEPKRTNVAPSSTA